MTKTQFSLLDCKGPRDGGSARSSAGQAGALGSGRRPRAPSVLVPADGCLAGAGRWLLLLGSGASRCVEPLPWRRGSPEGWPEDLPGLVAQALTELDRSSRAREEMTSEIRKSFFRESLPKEVVIGADVDPLAIDDSRSLAVLHAAEHILNAGIAIRLCTRGAPHPDSPFGRLLATAASSGKGTLEVAMVSIDPSIARWYEPAAPAPGERLLAASRLKAAGVNVEGRLGPMLPWIADTTAHLEEAVAAFRDAGIRRVRAAYLQLDQYGTKRLRRLPPAHRALLKGCFRGRPRYDGEALLLPRDLRSKGYARLTRIAARAEITVIVCKEANPDISFATACLSEHRGRGRAEHDLPGSSRSPRARVDKSRAVAERGASGKAVLLGRLISQPTRRGRRRVLGGRQLDLFG